MSDDVKRFAYIRYFCGFPCPHFISIKSVESDIEANVEETKDIEGTKVGQISRKICIYELSWCSKLSRLSNKIFSASLSRFLSTSIMGL